MLSNYTVQNTFYFSEIQFVVNFFSSSLGVSEETGESETQASLLQAQLNPLKQELSNKDVRIAELVRYFWNYKAYVMTEGLF